jgi:hypothetical protein
MLAPPTFGHRPPRRGIVVLLAATLLAWAGAAAPAPPPALAQRPTPTARPTRQGPGQRATPTASTGDAGDPSMMATWRPEYTSWLTLPGDESPITLAAQPDGSALWMATGTTVARLADGVWSLPEQPTDADHIYAMAVNDKAVWAVGWSGGAWRRNGGGFWSNVSSGTIGDLYALDASSTDGAVWAAGFDYDTASGVIVRWQDGPAGPGAGPEAVWTGGDLSALQLYATALDKAGTPWVGGCRITGWDESEWQPVLLRYADEAWTEVPQPLATGCVYGLAFAEDGAGWAAAGRDLLAWDGTSWRAENVAPPAADPDANPPVPEGVEWVRVAAGRVSLGADGPRRAAWAVAGVPTWSGYIRGQSPWRFDGSAWAPADVDYRGLPTQDLEGDVETAIEPRSFMALAADGTRAWSVNRTVTGAGDNAEAYAAIMALEEETVVLAHPLVLQPVSVAVPPAPTDGAHTTFVAGRLGRLPLARSGDVSWTADPNFRFQPLRRSQLPRRSHLDVPAADRGWQLTVAGPVSDSLAVAHRWDGERWHEQTAPAGLRQLRTLPDGGAWGRVARPGGAKYTGKLMQLTDERWQPVEGAPDPAEATPLCDRFTRDLVPDRLERQDCDVPRAPFDAVALAANGGREEPRAVVGWVAGADRRMHRWDGDTFEPLGPTLDGPVLDLALTDDGGGWAIVHDAAADPPTDRLLRLGNDRWQQVDQIVRRHPQLNIAVNAIDWQEMSVIDRRELWLRGRIFAPRLGRGDRVLVHLRGNRVEVFPLACNVNAMAAERVPGGTDLWLLGAVDVESCRMDRFPIPVYEQGDAVAGERERISRLRIRDRQGRITLPWVRR